MALGLPDRSSAHPAHRLDDDGLGKPWFHIYMFEDANPYSAAQTHSEGLTTPW